MQRNILLSGGYDSTYLVVKLIHDEKISTDDVINLIHIDYPNFTPYDRFTTENEAFDKLVEKFKEKYPDYTFTTVKLKVHYNTDSYDREFYGDNQGLCQPQMWLFSLLAMFSPENNVFYIGYNYDDEAPKLIDSIRKIVREVSNIANIGYSYQSNTDNSSGLYQFEFPLITYHKSELLVLLFSSQFITSIYY